MKTRLVLAADSKMKYGHSAETAKFLESSSTNKSSLHRAHSLD